MKRLNSSDVERVLAEGLGIDFERAAKAFLECLGYRSERTLPGQSGEVADFLSRSRSASRGTLTEQQLREHALSLRVLFQITDDEIRSNAQPSLFDSLGKARFDEDLFKSYVFVTVELKRETLSRSRYAELAREINKHLAMPGFVLFRTKSGLLTLAFVHRRQHKRDPKRQVLGRVSLVREIDPANPHRGHLDILAELSLNERLRWISSHGKRPNFDGLLAALLDTLDTQALNKRFYKDLFEWFTRAAKESKFPTGEVRTLSSEEHVIRLITRLLFVWFIREKGLVAEELFIEVEARSILKGYDGKTGDSYYRAILQNFFFATLNCEISERRWSEKQNSTHRIFSRYRFRDEVENPGRLLELFAQTPFINGGLFDCLDSLKSRTNGGYRIDCFSDNVTNPNSREYAQVSVPNRLFFDERGLFAVFNRYKFTVEENTPAEKEVALDPELLGSVFENLLAAYNPETRQTARKQTGSYYTPRPVVDYMVEEALVEALAAKALASDGDEEFWRERLRYLLDYEDAFDDARELFEEAEINGLIRAVSELKILDPACGSGAFPMGVLHKLTLALRRIDCDNKRWEELQKGIATARAAAAFDIREQNSRRVELQEISDTFERYRDSDFGRKLYLIQNSIFGVDIQTVACQIAKLRFFISLVIEQQRDGTKDNLGIRPLPNLETRFVAADALLPLRVGGTGTLTSLEVDNLQQDLRINRERYFHARSRKEKLNASDEDKRLRKSLADELMNSGMHSEEAQRVANWDPFDQNATACWFDGEYMFGNAAGFDVVIGNPPYVRLQKNEGRLANHYKDAGFETFVRTGDLYQLFIEKGCHLLCPSTGVLSYITSNSWLKAGSGGKTRSYLSQRHGTLQLLEMGKDVFNAIVDTCVLLVRESGGSEHFRAVDMDHLNDSQLPPKSHLWGEVRPRGEVPWSILTDREREVFDKMSRAGTALKTWDVKINFGIKTGLNKAFIIDGSTRRFLIARDSRSEEIIKPLLRGEDVKRWRAQWADKWLIDTHNGYGGMPAVDVADYPAIAQHLDGHRSKLIKRKDQGGTPFNLRDCAYHENFRRDKVIWMDLAGDARFCYDQEGLFLNNAGYFIVGDALKYLCTLLNSSAVTWFVRNSGLSTGMGLVRWIKEGVDRIPIPKASMSQQQLLIRLLDQILAAKDADPDVDVCDLEIQINHLVYDLYGFTESEIATVERQ